MHRLWNIIKNFFAILGFVFLVIFIGFFLFFIIASSRMQNLEWESEVPVISDNTTVWYELNGKNNEHEFQAGQFENILDVLEGKSAKLSHFEILLALRQLVSEPKVKTVKLLISDWEASLAAKYELRQAILELKRAKEVQVFIRGGTLSDYYLASAASKVMAGPEDNFILSGVHSEQFFLKDALASLGVLPQFVYHGKYKSAPEMFTRNEFSENSLEMNRSILKNIYEQVLKEIKPRHLKAMNSNTFKIEQATLQAKVLAAGLLTGRQLKNLDLLDEMRYPDQFEPAKGKNKLSLSYYYRHLSPSSDKAKNAIGLLMASGEVHSSGNSGLSTPDAITPKNIRQQLEDLTDKRIKAIILRIDSPGGDAVAADEIWHLLSEYNLKVPIYVSMGSMAASGGYYIAAPGRRIYASPLTLTGSIGVFAGKFVVKPVLDKFKVHTQLISFGANAHLLSPMAAWDEQEANIMQKHVDEFYKVFVSKMAEGRHKSFDDIDTIAQGRVYTGMQAADLGLVDELGTWTDVIKKIEKDLNIKSSDIDLLMAPSESPGLGKFVRNMRRFGTELRTFISHTWLGLPSSFEIEKMSQVQVPQTWAFWANYFYVH